MKLKLDDNGILEISGAAASGEAALSGPVAAVLSQLFELLGADLCFTRDGCAALQFDAAPDAAISEMVDDGVIQIKAVDDLINALIAEIAEAPDPDDRADLIAFKTRLHYALSEVDSARARIDDAD